MSTSIANLALQLSASTSGLRTDLANAQGLINDFSDLATKRLGRIAVNNYIERGVRSQGNLQQYGGVAGGALNGVQGIGEALADIGEYAAPFVAIVGGITKVVETMIDFAKVADPAGAQRYDKAWQDLNGVIGNRFIPILSLATDTTRGLGDMLNDTLPSRKEFQEMADAWKPAMTGLVESAADFMKTIGTPAIRGVGNLVQGAGESVGGIYSGADFLAHRANMGINTISGALGFGDVVEETGAYKPKGSSYGMAPGMPSYMNGEDISRKAILDAYISGGQNEPAKDATAKEILRVNQELLDATKRFMDQHHLGTSVPNT